MTLIKNINSIQEYTETMMTLQEEFAKAKTKLTERVIALKNVPTIGFDFNDRLSKDKSIDFTYKNQEKFFN